MYSSNPKQKLRSLKNLFQKFFKIQKINDEINKIKTIEQEIIRDDLIYKTRYKKGKNIWFSKG